MAMVLIAVGSVITVIGGILYWGNVSGSFITFPYAGYITGAIGVAIAGFGYKKMKEAKEQQAQKASAPTGT